jgi:hypothetical protein
LLYLYILYCTFVQHCVTVSFYVVHFLYTFFCSFIIFWIVTLYIFTLIHYKCGALSLHNVMLFHYLYNETSTKYIMKQKCFLAVTWYIVFILPYILCCCLILCGAFSFPLFCFQIYIYIYLAVSLNIALLFYYLLCCYFIVFCVFVSLYMVLWFNCILWFCFVTYCVAVS